MTEPPLDVLDLDWNPEIEPRVESSDRNWIQLQSDYESHSTDDFERLDERNRQTARSTPNEG